MGSGARITALGHYQPATVVTNDELAKNLDTDDHWIRTRVGITSRRVAGPDETVDQMAAHAAGKALAAGGLSADRVDMVVVATCTAVERSPNTAARVADRLGLTAPALMDINVVCAGFTHALATAQHAIAAGAARNALVIGADKFTSVVDWTDRSTSILVGDGAGAALVEASDHADIGPVVWGSFPEMQRAVRIEGTPSRFSQEGQAVYRWATTVLPPFAVRTCEAAGVAPEELAGVVLHQANARIIDSFVKRLGAHNAVIATDVVESGNTSAASVPLAFSKLVERREVPVGAPVLLFGFGGNLSYAGQVVRSP
ncbi:MAG TPA: beta-ketoacyl-ACP synthase 3 [Pseudonocardiaceae bacterium]|jgi:3-oxoacyl-[acyl-carrier-protein] synthase-3|nr:beta-ketoacyl-ACP synthase 3 [Pseudonocardiaceae bacterium]